MTALTSVQRIVQYAQTLESKYKEAKKNLADAYSANATLSADLVKALSNDQADAEAIASAKSDAEASLKLATEAQEKADAANAKVNLLQALADADSLEDSEIIALVDSIVPVEPTVEPIEPEPTVESI